MGRCGACSIHRGVSEAATERAGEGEGEKITLGRLGNIVYRSSDTHTTFYTAYAYFNVGAYADAHTTMAC